MTKAIQKRKNQSVLITPAMMPEIKSGNPYTVALKIIETVKKNKQYDINFHGITMEYAQQIDFVLMMLTNNTYKP